MDLYFDLRIKVETSAEIDPEEVRAALADGSIDATVFYLDSGEDEVECRLDVESATESANQEATKW